MSLNTGINRVLLVGNVDQEPNWQTIDERRMLCFQLSTTEEIKKGNGTYEHIERHSIKMPSELIKNGLKIKKHDLIYLQGKIRTRIVYENDVKLYKTEIL